MKKSTFLAILISTVTAVDFSAIEAENEATHGMVLPRSIPSPIAAQTTVPTALAVGGGSILSVGNSEIIAKVIYKAHIQSNTPKLKKGLIWQETGTVYRVEGQSYYVGWVKNQHAYDVIVEVVFKSDYLNLTPEMSKFRLLPGAVATVAAKLIVSPVRYRFRFSKLYDVTVTKVDRLPLTPGIPTISSIMTNNGTDYRGVQNKTITGKTCQNWSAQAPHKHPYTPTKHPTAGLTDNFCRNPDGDATIWCYTNEADTVWETCLPISEAKTGNGADYRGAQTKTKSGLDCQKWGAQAPHMHKKTEARYPDSGLFDAGFENACRNPDGPDGEADIWCYTMSPTKLWEMCEPLAQ